MLIRLNVLIPNYEKVAYLHNQNFDSNYVVYDVKYTNQDTILF